MPYVDTVTGNFEIHEELVQYDRIKSVKIMMAIRNALYNFWTEKYVSDRYYMNLCLIFNKLVKHHFQMLKEVVFCLQTRTILYSVFL